jgi:membrane protease YdiL (CAAX protease family)
MFKQLSEATKGFIFYGITFVLALTFAATGGIAVNLYMVTPMLATLLMLLVVTKDGYTKAGWAKLGVHRLGLRGWRLALLLPLAVLLVSYIIVWSLGIAKLNLPTATGAWLDLGLNTIAGLVIGSLFAFGEEIGWRGYLLPRFANFKPVWAMLLVGLLHGLWHLPIILLTSFYHGAGNKLIIIPLFLLTLTVAGVFYGYLRFTFHSVWPVVLAHGAFNTYWENLNNLTVATSPLATEYLAGESGLLTLMGAIFVAFWLIKRFRNQSIEVNPGTKTKSLTKGI